MSEIKLTADSGGGTTSIKAPSSTTSNADVVLKLPVADGSSGQVLKTDGSGQLSFTSNAGTTINNNADNRVITGSGTANTLEGEANLTYNGTKLNLAGSNEADLLQLGTGNSAGNTFASIRGDNEAGIRIRGGGSERGGEIELGGGTRDTDPAVIKFSTNTSNSFQERMRIDSSGNVGIGTTSPADKFHVVAGSQRNFVVRSTGGEPHLYAQNDSGNVENLMIGGNNVIFKAGSGSTGNEIARISENGGITFNGDTAAANGLNDYEYGTFDPTFRENNNASNTSYAWRYGEYTKIGRIVHCRIAIGLSAFSGNFSEAFLGLPYTAYSQHGNSNFDYVPVLGYSYASGFGDSGSQENLFMEIYGHNVSSFRIVKGNSKGNVSQNDINSGQRIAINFTYTAAA